VLKKTQRESARKKVFKSMKATAIAPSNIAFIKYWGRKDEELRLPENGSVAMNLSDLLTTTTVEFDEEFQEDIVIINGKQEENEKLRAVRHLDRIRSSAKMKLKAKVVSENNFPSSTGLSSSASGFAALTVAGAAAAGLKLSEKELSILARQGSGSACRSIPDGFVEWLDGDTSETSYAVSLYKPGYWDIADIIAVVNVGPKDVATSEGMKEASSSPFFQVRRSHMSQKIKAIKKTMKQKDFPVFGELVEAEALELHAIMLTATPSLIYWLPGTVRVMRAVKEWRSGGLQVYFTVNTGQDIHLICEKKNIKKVRSLAEKIEGVQKTIVNYPYEGTRLIKEHLF
jgi:diphosphomevalonate decarboxylase